MKVISIAGARPQFIKVAVVSHAVPKVAADLAIEHKLIHTGQHYDAGMSDIFFEEMAIPITRWASVQETNATLTCW